MSALDCSKTVIKIARPLVTAIITEKMKNLSYAEFSMFLYGIRMYALSCILYMINQYIVMIQLTVNMTFDQMSHA